MPVCVQVVPVGAPIGADGRNTMFSTVPLIREDASCSSDLRLFTDAEIAAIQPPVNPERIADMQLMFYAFILALVIAWGAKQLLNLFSGDTNRD